MQKQLGIIIATNKLYVNEIKSHFSLEGTITTNEITAFYKKFDPAIRQSTVNWRVYKLVQQGVLKRIGRGTFSVSVTKRYVPYISKKIKAVNSKIHKTYPHLQSCIWQTSVLNEFMIHHPGRFYLIVEVERDAMKSIFYYFKEVKYSVFIEPSEDVLEKYLPIGKDIIIVKKLITEAPIQKENGVVTASLEKILVDIFCDEVIFSDFQGAEMRTIFSEAISKYTINRDRMLRYADRRRKKDKFSNYLMSVANDRQ